jgi:hypothetical protein
MAEQSYLMAEDLLLLLLDDETGALLADPVNVDAGLAGAVLLELAVRGRVRLHEQAGLLGTHVVRVSDASPTGDEGLDAALALVAEKDRTPTGVVEHLAPGLRRGLLDRLADRGVLEHAEGRVLGIFPRHRWPLRDARHETELRAAVRASLVDGAEPGERVGALVALLHAIGAEHRVLPFPGLSHRDLRARAAGISEETAWVSAPGAAGKDVVDATRAAIVATTVAAVASSPGGG